MDSEISKPPLDDEDEDARFAAMTPQQRLDVMLELNARHWASLGLSSDRVGRVIRIVRITES
jgi:hypothetical protein